MKTRGQVHSLATQFPEKQPPPSVSIVRVGPKGGLGIESRFVSRPSRSLVTIPSELSKLLLQLFSNN
jgi:hypothetical protein